MSSPRLSSSALAPAYPVDLPDHVGPGVAGADSPPDLAAIYRQNVDKVARWVGRLNGPDADPEDIVQEIFIIAQRRLPEWRGDAKITTWLYEITLRVVQDRRRRARWRRWWPGLREGRTFTTARDELANLPSDQPGPHDLLERRESAEALYRILDGLGEKYRTVIILFELEGLSGEEIAKLTGTSLSNVWIRLFRARQKFMQGFEALERSRKP